MGHRRAGVVLVRLCAVPALLALALPAPAEIHGMCCGEWLKLSESGAGFNRNFDCVAHMESADAERRAYLCAQLIEQEGVCPAVAQYCDDCENAADRLDGLIGRMKGLGEAIQAHLHALATARSAADAARDAIFGASGSAAGSLSALASALPAPGSSKVGKAAPWALAAIDADSKGDYRGFVNQTRSWWQQHALEQVRRGVIGRAASEAHDVFKQTGSGVWARQTYASRVRSANWIKKGQGVAQGLGAALALIDLHRNASRLADDLQAYVEHNREARAIQAELDELHAERDALQHRIDALRHCLAQRGASGAMLLPPSPADALLSLLIPRARAEPTGREIGGGNGAVMSEAELARLEDGLSDLRDVLARLQSMEDRLVEVLIPLTVFLVDDWERLDPALLEAMRADLADRLRALDTDLEWLAATGRAVVYALGGEPAVTTARAAFQDANRADAAGRLRAAEVLGRLALDSDAATDALLAGLGEESALLRDASATALGTAIVRADSLRRRQLTDAVVAIAADNPAAAPVLVQAYAEYEPEEETAESIRATLLAAADEAGTRLGLRLLDGLPGLSRWYAVPHGAGVVHALAEGRRGSLEPVALAPGRYDIHVVQRSLRRHAPVRVTEAVTVRNGTLIVAVDAGLSLRLAAWVRPVDFNHGWWGVARAGSAADDRDSLVHWQRKPGSVVLAPGRYDVYWKQDYDNPPFRLAGNVAVDRGRITEVAADTGIVLQVRNGRLPDSRHGWWGVTEGRGDPVEPLQSAPKPGQALLLAPGTYRVLWKQDSSGAPKVLADGVRLARGQLKELSVAP